MLQKMKIACLFLLAAFTAAAKGYDAGVAKLEITPKQNMWMSGYGARTKPSTGVLQPLWVKSLAIRDDRRNTFVIVTTDLVGLPKDITDAISARVQKEYNINRANLLFNASHTHTGPFVKANLSTLFSFAPEDQRQVDEYAQTLSDAMFNAIGASLARMEAVELTFGTGTAGFAVNRRQKMPDGTFKIGVNPDGPIDHSVPVLKVVSKRSSKTLAILTGYACHNTTLTGEFYEFSGDYAGFAQAEIEANNPGAVALFLILCGADQNPNPRSSVALAKKHGKELADGVQAVLDGNPMKPVEGPITAALEMAKLNFAIHTRETFEKELTSKIPSQVRRAKMMLAKYDERAPIRTILYPVQAVSFGKSLTFLTLAGEVVLDYSIRAKREFPKVNLVVVGYSNDMPGYIPSKRVLLEGGYEAVDSMIYYGQPGPFSEDVEELIFAAVRRVMKRVSSN